MLCTKTEKPGESREVNIFCLCPCICLPACLTVSDWCSIYHNMSWTLLAGWFVVVFLSPALWDNPTWPSWMDYQMYFCRPGQEMLERRKGRGGILQENGCHDIYIYPWLSAAGYTTVAGKWHVHTINHHCQLLWGVSLNTGDVLSYNHHFQLLFHIPYMLNVCKRRGSAESWGKGMDLG